MACQRMSWNRLVHRQPVVVWPAADISWMARDFCLAVESESEEKVWEKFKFNADVSRTGIKLLNLDLECNRQLKKIWILFLALIYEKFIGSMFILVAGFVADRWRVPVCRVRGPGAGVFSCEVVGRVAVREAPWSDLSSHSHPHRTNCTIVAYC